MNRIKSLREEKDWSQAQLGNKLGVKSPVVSKYENGEVTLTEKILRKLSDVFCCSIDYILCNDGTFNDNFNGEELNLISDYRKLDTGQRITLLNMMAFLRSPQSKNIGGFWQYNNGNNCFMSVGDNNNYVNNR